MKKSLYTPSPKLPLTVKMIHSFLALIIVAILPACASTFNRLEADDPQLRNNIKSSTTGETITSKMPALVVQSGHSDETRLLSFSPDSTMLASASDDGTVKLWDIVQGRLRRTINVSQFWIHSLAFSSNNKWIATGSGDNLVRLWNVQTGQQKASFEKHTHAVTSLAFSPDDTVLASGSGACGNRADIGTIGLWNINSGMPLGELTIDKGNIVGLMFRDKDTLVSVSENVNDSIITVWNLKTMSSIKEIRTDLGRLWGPKRNFMSTMNQNYVAIHGGYIQSEGPSTRKITPMVKVWELPSGREKHDANTKGLWISDIAILPGQTSLWMLAATSRQIYHLDIETDVTHKGIIIPDSVQKIEIAPSGRLMALVSRDNTISLLSTELGSSPKRLSSVSRSVRSIASSRNGEFLAYGSGDGGVSIWDIKLGQRTINFQAHRAPVHSISFCPNDECLMTAAIDGEVSLWDPVTGNKNQTLKLSSSTGVDPIERDRLASRCEINFRMLSAPRGLSINGSAVPRSLMVASASPIEKKIAYAGYPEFVNLWNFQAGNKEQTLHRDEGEYFGVNALAFSPKGDSLAFGDESGQIFLKDLAPETKIRKMETHGQKVNALAFSQSDTRLLASADSDGSVKLWNTMTGQVVQTTQGCTSAVLALAFSATGEHLATGRADNKIEIWKVPSLEPVATLEGHSSSINTLEYAHNNKYFMSGSEDGTVMVWDSATYRHLASVVTLGEDGWIVFSPDGRFDTNNLEKIRVLSWIMPDDPLRLLSPEIFMRDYYEPRLLARVLSGEKFTPIRPLDELCRMQPHVKIIKIEPADSDNLVKVTVKASSARNSFQQEGQKADTESGVYDLRLYRNGQLVDQWPKPSEITYQSFGMISENDRAIWQKATKVSLDPDGKTTITFIVQIPLLRDSQEVEFTAYAFNLDRVKSETDRKTYKVPGKPKSVSARAYIVTLGVSGNEDPAWSGLAAPAQDAKLILKTLVKQLSKSHKYEKVVPVPLITVPPAIDFDDEETQRERRTFIRPTKQNIKTVIDLMAGREILDPTRLEQIPQELRKELHRARPEDLVILSFSSHGVTDDKGEFYLLPYDLGRDSGGKVTNELCKRSISSQELSLWLSRVDAEQMFMVIDACHSGAAVEVEGFKPGPMGNPGLGQLSYDKMMPILAATQTNKSAWARGRYSFLTFALAQEGIEEKDLALADALKYAEARVPKLYEDNMGKEERNKIQQPKLFDFKKATITN